MTLMYAQTQANIDANQLIKRRNLPICANILSSPLIPFDSLSCLLIPFAKQYQTIPKAWDSYFVEQIRKELLVL